MTTFDIDIDIDILFVSPFHVNLYSIRTNAISLFDEWIP